MLATRSVKHCRQSLHYQRQTRWTVVVFIFKVLALSLSLLHTHTPQHTYTLIYRHMHTLLNTLQQRATVSLEWPWPQMWKQHALFAKHAHICLHVLNKNDASNMNSADWVSQHFAINNSKRTKAPSASSTISQPSICLVAIRSIKAWLHLIDAASVCRRCLPLRNDISSRQEASRVLLVFRARFHISAPRMSEKANQYLFKNSYRCNKIERDREKIPATITTTRTNSIVWCCPLVWFPYVVLTYICDATAKAKS